MIKIEVDLSDLKLDIDEVEKAVSEELETTAYKCERTAKEFAPYETGDLRKSIHTEGSGLNWTVSTNVEYAHYMEYGTSPHIIYGNPFLHFKGVYRTYVMHPGNKAYLYMQKAFDTHMQGIEERVANAIMRLL